MIEVIINSTKKVLIETSWNVKYVYGPTMADLFTVLIETSWNVKVTNKGWRVWSSIVLIETSWNVKEIAIAREMAPTVPY